MIDDPFSRAGQLLLRYSRVFAETPHYRKIRLGLQFFDIGE